MANNPAMLAFLSALRSWANWSFLIGLVASVAMFYIRWNIPNRKERRAYVNAIYTVTILLITALGVWKISHV